MARRQITPSLARNVPRWPPMCDRWRVNRARTGEKYFAPTSMVRRRVAATRSQRVGDCASMAHVGAKYFSPVHPWCGGARRARDHNVWAIAHQWRTYGRNIFRPYNRGALLNLPCATIWGAAVAMVGRLRINRARRGEKYFAPTHAAAHGGCAIETCGRLRINRARPGEIFFARTNAARC